MLETSLSIADWSAQLLLYNLYIPLLLPCYDAVVVPIVQRVQGAGDDPLAVSLALLSACIFVPLEIIAALFELSFGFCMEAGCAIAAELEGSFQEAFLHEA